MKIEKQWLFFFKELLSTLDFPSNEGEAFLDVLGKARVTQEAKTTHQTDLTIAEFLDFFTYDTTGNSSQLDIPREPVTVFMQITDDGNCLEKLGEYVPFVFQL